METEGRRFESCPPGHYREVAQLVEHLHKMHPVELMEYYMNSVYNDLVIELVKNCKINSFDARKIVTFLKDSSLIDYDTLKEYFNEYEKID